MKSVLVIDMPKSCKECFLCGMGGVDLGQYVCCFTGEHSESPHLIGCPLKPLPERKDEGSVLNPLPLEVYMHRYGFNECLDEITGETE